MTVRLPKLEIIVYFLIWVSSFSFALYKVYLDGMSLAFDEMRSNDFLNGWKLINRKKDTSDEEWELWIDFLFKLIPWIILHLCISEFIKLKFVEALPMCYMLTTMGVMLSFFPFIVPAFFILELSVFFLAMLTSSKIIIWTLGMFVLLFVNNTIKSSQITHFMDKNQINLIYVANGWFYVRCLDFVLSDTTENLALPQKFFNYLGYIFYLPTFFLGPFIPYNYFKFQIDSCPRSLLKKRIKMLLSSIALYITYYLVYEIALHYLYCNAMHYEIKNYLMKGMWTVSGVGICLANFFYLKYVIIYGIATSIAKAENYQVPPPPRCIYRIHLYSNMWRHFDRGFYLFMFGCIYSPICGHKGSSLRRRMFASFLCFMFVYLWHGGTSTVLYWSMFNYIGLITEALCKFLWNKTSFIQLHVSRKINKSILRRLEALAASPLWLLAVISNFIFFGGQEMGLIFLKNLTQGNLIFYATLMTIAYSMCQVSMEITILEKQKQKM